MESNDSDNLTISNKLKGILTLQLQNNKIKVVENLWTKAVKSF